MLVKILGAIDIIGALVLIFGASMDLPFKILWIFAMVFIAKSSLGLWKEIGSWIDVSIGFLFLLMVVINLPLIISLIGGFILIQKGAISFL